MISHYEWYINIKLLIDALNLFVSTVEMSKSALNANKYLLFELNDCAGKELMILGAFL